MRQPEYLPDFSSAFKQHQDEFDAVLFDIDGTLAIGSTPLPGVLDFLQYLSRQDIPFLLLTNDAGASHEQKAGILQRGGLPVTPHQILSAGDGLKWWAKQNYRGGLFFQYGSFGTPSYVENAGIEFTKDPERIRECCGVLGGEEIFDWRISLEAAFNLLLKHPEYPYIIGNPDPYWVSNRKAGCGIGAGGLARMVQTILLSAGVDIQPVYLGKPYEPVYQSVIPYLRESFSGKSFDDPGRIIMVGDMLFSDIAGARKNNFRSALVMTGATTPDVLSQTAESDLPEWICQRI